MSIVLGLISAVVWGAGDFTGGIASRKTGAFRVVFFGEIVGILILVIVALGSQESMPNSVAILKAALAGALGSLGLVLLYHALSTGSMSIAAPVSALAAGVLPVVVGSFTEGLPGGLTLMGFAFALMAIWFVSQNPEGPRNILAHISDLRLPLLAGVGFGCYFVIMHSAAQESTWWPMVISRAGGIAIIGTVILMRRERLHVARDAWGVIGINGVLDVGGNTFYILAGQIGRMDVAAVLSSLYPGVTVILAGLLLKERLSRTQWAGIALALVAILLFTL
jgi:uncharacterized membrane protein